MWHFLAKAQIKGFGGNWEEGNKLADLITTSQFEGQCQRMEREREKTNQPQGQQHP
jgi:hypothetical protein